jgi:branched-chain amino acid transport system substrate-binding protein
MGYKGVKFDDKGQNVLAAGLVIQLQDGENYVAVWPKNQAKTAPALPYRAGDKSRAGCRSRPR